jgi:hypothetical protein
VCFVEDLLGPIEGGSRLIDADYSVENKIPSPKELNKQTTNAEQTIKTNQQTNKQNRTKK